MKLDCIYVRHGEQVPTEQVVSGSTAEWHGLNPWADHVLIDGEWQFCESALPRVRPDGTALQEGDTCVTQDHGCSGTYQSGYCFTDGRWKRQWSTFPGADC